MTQLANSRERLAINSNEPRSDFSCLSRLLASTVIIFCVALWAGVSNAAASVLSGNLTDTQGKVVSGATISVLRRADSSRRITLTDENGLFSFGELDAGEYRLNAEFAGFAVVTRTVVLSANNSKSVDLQFSNLASQNESVTVTADVSDVGVFVPDPAQRIMIRDETLDANPGRPGMPISIPGMPVESPAGGVKPPQYFVPGVAGDHGEPIAMFFQVGGYLFQNNLPANAHGNGYTDPNVIIPVAIENVQTDGGAFNVREGNNSENAAIVFGLRDRLEPMARLTADARDLNLVTGWSPANPLNKSWVGAEISFGNGFLKRLEHRKQYKGNVSKVFDFGKNELTVYGIGYYGFAFQPGLIAIDTSVPDDTIDPRQQEETSNGALIFNDIWHATNRRQFQFSGFYRYYTLDVRPNFGFIAEGPTCGSIDVMPDCGTGLIRQSEHRNVNSEQVLYSENYSKRFSLLAGTEFRREAPSALDLDRADDAGLFYPVTANNLIMNFDSPFVAVDGALSRFMHYNLGYRRDEVNVDNKDLYRPQDSFSRSAPINSPKGTITFFPAESSRFLPTVAYSYGQSFHVNDPRIGTTAIEGGTIVSKARSNQLVIATTLAQTDLRVTLEHVTTAQSLARISNDTGLQEDEGPGIVKSLTFTARRNFAHGFVQGLYARADARDRLTGEPTPEAPRLIWDVLATVNKLPAHLVARGEYEQVGRKPLGDGFVAVPVREFRGAVIRPFETKGVDLGLNVYLANGYGGQTLETLALPSEGDPFERITGFPLKSYVTASLTYHFRRH
jgi:Carboxypeptidase regulatory-like domain